MLHGLPCPCVLTSGVCPIASCVRTSCAPPLTDSAAAVAPDAAAAAATVALEQSPLLCKKPPES